MGITKTLIDDWKRERKIKKHKQEVDAILKKRQITRVTNVVTDSQRKSDARRPVDEKQLEKKSGMDSMAIYDRSGYLDRDLSEQLQKDRLNGAVQAITRMCQTEKNIGGLDITCSHDGTNVLISVYDKSYVVGKWRFQLNAENQADQPLRLYHLNYHYNQAPGPNFHLQHQAKELYTAEDVAVYILRHDKKKVQNDRKNRQDNSAPSPTDDLIGE